MARDRNTIPKRVTLKSPHVLRLLQAEVAARGAKSFASVAEAMVVERAATLEHVRYPRPADRGTRP